MKIIIKRFNEGESIANMVVEISRWSHAKLELNPKEQLNPIYHVSNLSFFADDKDIFSKTQHKNIQLIKISNQKLNNTKD